MKSGNKNHSPQMRQALLRYNARFPLPVDFIANTMLEVNRVAERRAYIRGLITISIVSLLMIALTVALFHFFGVKMAMTLPIVSTLVESANLVESIVTSPLTVMLAVSAGILLSLDSLMRRHFAARHAS